MKTHHVLHQQLYMKQACFHCRYGYSEMEALYSSVDGLHVLKYALRVGFVDLEIPKNWAWVLTNMALVVTAMWAFGISRWVKQTPSTPLSHSTASATEDSITATGIKESTTASNGITEGSNRGICDFSKGRIYMKCEGSLDEFTPKQGSCVEEGEVPRGRNPVLYSYSLSDNTFSEDKCMDFVYSIGMSCSRDIVVSVWDKGVGKYIHNIMLDEYAITVERNCLVQNSPKSVLLSNIVCNGEEKCWLCLWDRRQPVKALSFSLGDELALLHAVEFDDTNICVSDGLNGKIFDLRMAASPVYPTSKGMEAPIERQNQSVKTWSYLEGSVLENTAEFALSERVKHGIMEWRNACMSSSDSFEQNDDDDVKIP